jgi:putative ABC transport system permease protein
MRKLLVFYAKLFRRSVLKHKLHFLLNFLGLTLGISCFLLALLYVFYETSYDSYHVNRDRIARIVTTVESGGSVTHTAYSNDFLTPNLPKLYPDIETMVRYKPFDGKAALRTGGQNDPLIPIANLYYSDPDVFKVFSYTLLEGDKAGCLSAPNSLVLSRRMVRILFGDKPAIGQAVQLNGKLLKITGVMADLPGNSDIALDGLVSMNTLDKNKEGDLGWVYTYVLLKNKPAMASFQAKLDEFADKYLNPQLASQATAMHYQLEPLRTLHFSNSYVYDTPKGNRVSVDIFLTLGILILVIACTNSVNMMVVRSFSRSLEVTMQKIYGASRRELVVQQLLESLVMGVMAIGLSFLIVAMLLPVFAGMVDRPMRLTDLFNFKIAGAVGGILLVLMLSSAVYSGLYMQRERLADLLRSKTGKGQRMWLVPRLMLGFQFFISIGMVAAAILVLRQVDYLRHIPLGFDARNVVVLELPQGAYAKEGDKYLKNELSADPAFTMLSFCSEKALPGQFADLDVMEYRQNGVLVNKGTDDLSADENYLGLLGIPVIRGSGFHGVKDSTARDEVMVNELFVRQAGWTHPIGQTIKQGEDAYHVVGVVQDFHFGSLHNPMTPMVIYPEPDNLAYLLVKVADGKTAGISGRLQSIWRKAFPQFPFSYFFLDQHLLQQYKEEGHLLSCLLTLSLLVIVISCIGLMAYTSYVIRIALKDIAIRRIVGATFGDIFRLFNRQFVLLLVIGLAVAAPVSWYFLGRWLAQFAYHVDVRPGDYFIAAMTMGGIVGLAVLNYTWRCVRISPAKIIREQ